MNELRINWNEVRKRMIDRGVDSMTELAAATGINKNTLSKRRMSFFSTTVNRLADYLGCDPRELLTVNDTRVERKAALLAQAEEYKRKVKGNI